MSATRAAEKKRSGGCVPELGCFIDAFIMAAESVDYVDADPAERRLHAAHVHSLARRLLEARVRAAVGNFEFSSVYDIYILHAIPAAIVDRGHALVLGREYGQETQVKETKAAIFRRRVVEYLVNEPFSFNDARLPLLHTKSNVFNFTYPISRC